MIHEDDWGEVIEGGVLYFVEIINEPTTIQPPNTPKMRPATLNEDSASSMLVTKTLEDVSLYEKTPNPLKPHLSPSTVSDATVKAIDDFRKHVPQREVRPFGELPTTISRSNKLTMD